MIFFVYSILYFSLDNSYLVEVESFNRTSIFLRVSHIREPGENAALQRSAMFIENVIPTFLHSRGVLCAAPTYRSAGAGMLVGNVAINILLRWSKEGFRFVRCVLIW